MITRMEVSGFRAFKNIAIDLQPFQVLVGPNASGKSSFFDVFAFVRDVLRVGLDKAMTGDIQLGIPLRARSLQDLTWQRQGGPIHIALTAKIPERLRAGSPTFQYVRYELAIDPTNGPRFKSESLWLLKSLDESNDSQKSSFPADPPDRPVISTRPPNTWRKVVAKTDGGNDYFRSEKTKWNNLFRLGPTRSALANLPEDESRFPTAIWFKRLLMEGIYVLSLNADAMRLPCPAGSTSELLPDGSNLPWVVHALETSAPERLEDWVAHLQTALADIHSIRTRERPEDRARYLEVTYHNGLAAPSWLLSDGTLRMIALTLLAYTASPPPILLIEEPENGIHPKAIETVLQSLQSVYDSQVFCATHSPLVLSLLEAKQLLCFGKTAQGAIDIVRGQDHPELRDWKTGLHLGDLLALGVLG